jgi:hypothetical protein
MHVLRNFWPECTHSRTHQSSTAPQLSTLLSPVMLCDNGTNVREALDGMAMSIGIGRDRGWTSGCASTVKILLPIGLVSSQPETSRNRPSSSKLCTARDAFCQRERRKCLR